ncbi:MAG: tetratricopeptide repeat protein [Paludibacteraceae bacterium]|nr:tetratricopeptide repeat protein [Paludibacteraceae bacterium]
MKRYIVLILMLFPMFALFAQKESRNVNAGNKYYEKEKYVESEVEYRKGLEQNNSSFSANFNLGNALYRQEKYEDAAQQFEKAAALAGSDSKRIAAANHNKGNALLSAQKIDEAIEAYKEALRNNPNDHDTRYNLAYAKHLRQQQQQQEQGMSKENAEQILQALMEDEKQTQEKVKEQEAKKAKRYRVEKDW